MAQFLSRRGVDQAEVRMKVSEDSPPAARAAAVPRESFRPCLLSVEEVVMTVYEFFRPDRP